MNSEMLLNVQTMARGLATDIILAGQALGASDVDKDCAVVAGGLLAWADTYEPPRWVGELAAAKGGLSPMPDETPSMETLEAIAVVWDETLNNLASLRRCLSTG